MSLKSLCSTESLTNKDLSQLSSRASLLTSMDGVIQAVKMAKFRCGPKNVKLSNVSRHMRKKLLASKLPIAC